MVQIFIWPVFQRLQERRRQKKAREHERRIESTYAFAQNCSIEAAARRRAEYQTQILEAGEDISEVAQAFLRYAVSEEGWCSECFEWCNHLSTCYVQTVLVPRLLAARNLTLWSGIISFGQELFASKFA